MAYTASLSVTIPGLRAIVREDEGFIDFQYGSSFDKSIVPQYDTGPYLAYIYNSGVLVDTVSIPHHFWMAAWWYDLGTHPVTVIRSPSTLIAAGYLPPIGNTGIAGTTLPTPGSVTFPGPMGIASDEAGYEPTTGGRGGLGIVTDEEAEWILTGDARNMLTDAQAVATQPIWRWDDTPGAATGKLIDPIARPFVTGYGTIAQGGPPNWLGPFPNPPTGTGAALQPWSLDTAHMMEVCAVVAMATGAPRYVRAAQARTLYAIQEDAYYVGLYGAVTVWNRQGRATAWLLRELFYCYWATYLAEQAGNLPSDCLPSSVFKQVLDNQASQFHTYIEGTDYCSALSLVFTQNSQNSFWQTDMIMQVVWLLAARWPTTWKPIALKLFKSLAARVNADGNASWPPAFPTWYWAYIYKDNGAICADYAELWSVFTARQIAGNEPSNNNGQITAAQVSALAIDPLNGLTFIPQLDTQYEDWAFGALAHAVYQNRSGPLAGQISAAFPRLEAAYTDYYTMMSKRGGPIAQCSFAVTITNALSITLARASQVAVGAGQKAVTLARATMAAAGNAVPASNIKTTVRLAQAAFKAFGKPATVTISQIWGKVSKSKAPWKRIY